MASSPTGLAGLPPPTPLEDWLGSLLHDFNPGGIFAAGPPASLPVPRSAGGTGADEPAKTGVPSPQKAPPAPVVAGLLSGVIPSLLSEVEVYGFLLLLAAIGLYGLFAPQVNLVVQRTGKALTAA